MRKFKDAQLRELHSMGLTDREIAIKLNVTQAAINYRREKLGLKNNYIKHKFSDDDILKLHSKGLTDKEIAEKLNVTSAAVNYRRGRLELKSNYAQPQQVMAMVGNKISIREIAEHFNVSENAINHLISEVKQ